MPSTTKVDKHVNDFFCQFYFDNCSTLVSRKNLVIMALARHLIDNSWLLIIARNVLSPTVFENIDENIEIELMIPSQMHAKNQRITRYYHIGYFRLWCYGPNLIELE